MIHSNDNDKSDSLNVVYNFIESLHGGPEIDLAGDSTGWLVHTSVRKSNIPGGGKGRFAEENVKEGTIMRIKRRGQQFFVFENPDDIRDMGLNHSRGFDFLSHFAIPFLEWGDDAMMFFMPPTCCNHNVDRNLR